MSDPYIVMSAPNGARRQQSDHPELPITPVEMAKCAEEILSAGASILHLHVRDDKGGHSLDIERYKSSISAVKNTVGNDLIIQATTESVGIYSREQQIDMVKNLKPEATSLALRELCPSDEHLADFSDFIKWINTEHIFPQYILYDEADFDRFEEYRKKGVFHCDNPFSLLVLGSYQGHSNKNDHTTNRLKEKSLNTNFPWAVCGFAENEKECVSHSVLNNGHIRVGFENNIWRDHDTKLANNAEMIHFSTKVASDNNRPVATAADVRNIFNL